MDILNKTLAKIKKISPFSEMLYLAFCFKRLAIYSFLIILPFLSACDYLNKCIEADDFGESQIEFLEIKSNNLEDECKFDAKYLSDPLTEDAKLNGEFGEEMKKCLFLDKGSISYEGKPYSFDFGCASIDKTIDGITDDQKMSQIRTMCVSSCRAGCIKDGGTSSTSSEPDWKYTSNSLILSPETQIKITATGSVNLRSSISEDMKFTFSPNSFLPNISSPFYRKSGDPISLLLKGGYRVNKIGDTSSYYYGTDQSKGNVGGVDCILSANCYIKPLTSFARRTLIYARTDKSKINVKNKEEWRSDLLPSIDYLYDYGGKLANSLNKVDPVYNSVCDSANNSCKLIITNANTSLKLEIKSKSGNNLSNIVYNKITKDQNGNNYYVQKSIATLGATFNALDIVNSEDSIVIANSNDIEFKATALSFKVPGATQVKRSGFLYFSYLNALVTKIKTPLTIAFPSSTIGNEDYKDNNFEFTGSGDANKYFNWSGGHFIRKGSAFILDYSFLLNSDADIAKINNIAFAIDFHRPAVFCSSVSQTKQELDKNPNCLSPVVDSTTGMPIGCKDQAGLCDNDANSYYCPSSCRGVIKDEKFVDYLACDSVNGQSKMSCSIKDFSNNPLFSYNSDGTINNLIRDIWSSDPNCSAYRVKCEDCFKERYKQATSPYYINSQLDQCYDLENYGKTFSDFISENDEVKNNYKIKEFNGYYGSIGSLERGQECGYSSINELDCKGYYKGEKCGASSTVSSIDKLSCDGYYKLVKNISTTENANIEFLNILNEDLNIFYNSSYSGKYNITSEVINISTFDTKTTYRNGEMLEVKLCTDTADKNCELKPNIIKYETLSSIQTITDSSAYNFDQSGFLTRILSTEATATKNQCSVNSCYDCMVQKNGIGNFVNSKYMCHTVGVKYDSSGNPIKDSRYNQDLVNKVRLGFKIKDPDSGSSAYSDNIGSYSVKVELRKTTDFGADLIKSIVAPVLEYVDGKYAIVNGKEVKVKDSMFEYHYKNLIADYRYKLLLNTCMMMFVMFYGLGYIIGISKLNHIELIHRAIKIGIIYMFVGKYGWEWFQAIFVTGFKDGVDYLVFNMASVFDNSPELLSAIDKNYFRDKSVLFSSSDAILKMIFSDPVIFKILALLSASLFGFVYLTILGYGLMLYIYAISNATLIYLTAQFFISILFLLAPIFFILLLFSPTKEIFDNWIKHMIGLSLQQVFVLITVALFNAILYEVIKSSLGYRVCWDEVWVINLGIIRFSLLSFWTVPAFAPREVVNLDLANLNSQPLEGLPSLFKILSIWAIASLMKHFVRLSAEIGGKIGELSEGGMSAVNLSRDVADRFGSYFDGAKNIASKAGSFVHDKTIGKLGDKINDKLFGYGPDAEKRRENQKKQNKATDDKVNSLIKEGDTAVARAKEDYLQSKINLEIGIKNVGDLAKYENMTPDQFNEGLSKIRNDAIESKFDEIKNKDPLATEKDKKDEVKNILNEAKSGSVKNRFDGNMFYDIYKAMMSFVTARNENDNQLRTKDIDNFKLSKISQDRKEASNKKEQEFMQSKSSGKFLDELSKTRYAYSWGDFLKCKFLDELSKTRYEGKGAWNAIKSGYSSAKSAAIIAGAPVAAAYYGAKAIKDKILKKDADKKDSKDRKEDKNSNDSKENQKLGVNKPRQEKEDRKTPEYKGNLEDNSGSENIDYSDDKTDKNFNNSELNKGLTQIRNSENISDEESGSNKPQQDDEKNN